MTRRSTLFAATLAAMSLVAATPGAAGADPGGVSCQYVVLSSWHGGFTADLRIVNDGPTIDGWTVRWTTPVPTSNVIGWSARMTQRGAEIVAVNMSWNAVVRTGMTTAFAWSASAPSNDVPTDITINGSPC